MSFWGAAGGSAAGARLLNEPEVGVEQRALRRATHFGQLCGDQALKKEMHVQLSVLWAKVAGERAPARSVEVQRARS